MVLSSICGIFLPLDTRGDDEVSQISNLTDAVNKDGEVPYQDDDEIISPFLVYEDGYRWPDLYSEIDECIESSILVVALAELRRLAKDPKSQLKQAAKILTLPLSHRQVMEFVIKNKEKLTDTGYTTSEFADMLHLTNDRCMICQRVSSHRGSNAQKKETPGVVNLRPARILAIDDDFPDPQANSVYSVEVNFLCKRVTVAFRNTQTKTDWAKDSQIWMQDVENPVAKHATQKPTVRVHHGFFKYLFAQSTRGRVKGPNGENLSQFQEILQLHVLPTLKAYPDYKLYVTGHSLGGALATLFGFAAAAEPDADIPKPVTVVSIASPYVGDESFRSAHQVLEGTGRLRHVRVSSSKDIVPLVPKISFKWNIFDSSANLGALFKHVGMNLRLYDGDTPCEIVYPAIRTGKWTSWWEEWSRGWEQSLITNWAWKTTDYFGPNHNLRHYDKRLRANKPTLQSMQLNDCYSRRDIVGYLVPQF